MKIWITLVFILFITSAGLSQKVGSNPPKIYIENYSPITNDGTLFFDIDVRIADCLSYIEVNDMVKLKKKKTIWDKIHDWWWFKVLKKYDFEISKTFIRKLKVDDYYIAEIDDGQEHIYVKCELMNMKSLFGRKTKKEVQINLVSLSMKTVYSKEFTLYKSKLIQNYENR